MLNLILTIILTSYLFFAFKLFPRFNVNTFHAIIINYATCIVTGLLFSYQDFSFYRAVHSPWIFPAVILGLFFVSAFYLIAYSSQKAGISITSVASKMSLIVPVLFSLFFIKKDFNNYNFLDYLVFAIAIVSVVLSSIKKDTDHKKSNLWIPIAVFIGTGAVDTLINYVNSLFIHASDEKTFPIVGFFCAGFFGSIILIYQLVKKKSKISFRSLLGGIALGIPNYFSIYFLLKTLTDFASNGALVFPMANIGVILFSTLLSIVFLKEKLSYLNFIGVGLGVISLVLLIL